MTTQDILSEAQRLSVAEQIHLASQLMQLVEQSIQPSQQQIQAKKNTTPQPNSIDYLMQHPIPVSQYHPLKRDELYDR
jgi:diketogulonate reductase-like aldo/keto reductase